MSKERVARQSWDYPLMRLAKEKSPFEDVNKRRDKGKAKAQALYKVYKLKTTLGKDESSRLTVYVAMRPSKGEDMMVCHLFLVCIPTHS
jgi:hypothetical protein